MRALAAGAPLARMRRRAARARTAECSAAASTVVSAELGTAIELWRVRPTVPEPVQLRDVAQIGYRFPGNGGPPHARAGETIKNRRP